jgi:L-malate glycosyltransferase
MINILEMESSKGWGGQEKRTVRLVNNLPQDEYKVYWAVEEDSTLYQKQSEINAEFFTIPLNRIYNFKTIFKLAKFIKEKNIDIISTHSGKDAWIGNIVGLITGVKVVRVRHLIVPIKSPASYNLASKVITVSEQVRCELKDSGVKKEKLQTIYTGIDTKRFSDKKEYDLRDELGISNDTKLIGCVAVLRGAKRHIDLIKTFSKLDVDSKLIIVGDGPMRLEIEKTIKQYNMEDKVIMLGHRNDIAALLPNFDIFVLASRHEALGTSLLEAQSCGVPVVASNVGGIPEALDNGNTGLLFDNFDMLEAQLNELLEDESKLQTMKDNCRKFIVEKFSVEKMMEDTKKLYKELSGK